MRNLLTGGAGFIGSHLCERLLALGHEVICLDNFFTGSKANVRGLLDNHDFELLRHDIITPIDLEVDRVFNLACPASPVHYQFDPVRTIQANVLGVTNMLELARRTKARILQASTSEVYGDPLVHPQTEDYWGHVNPIGPRGVYDEAKRFAEALTLAYHRSHGLDVRIVRIFNTYGPRLRPRDGRVVSNFLVQAIQREPITVYGDGKQTRSFCYVEDEIRGIVALLNSDYVGPVNIGNPNEFTILELAEAVIEVTGSSSEIVFEDLPVDDPMQRKPDIGLARSLFGWEPTIQLREGLERTYSWYKTELEARGA